MGNRQNQLALQRSKVIQNSAIKAVKHKFKLQNSHIEQLYMVFSKIDHNNKGHLIIEDFQRFLHKQTNSIVTPALQRLFSLMSDDSERLFFEQWIDGIMVFCLYNKQYLIRFIFDILDSDEDGFILKKQIISYVHYTNPKTGEQIFHSNFIEPIEQIKLDKFFHITFEDFRKFCDQFKFLCWPAIKLQEDLREAVIGPDFWEKVYQQIEKRESEMKNNNKKDNAIEDQKKKLEEKNRINAQKFSEFMKTKKIERNLFKPKLGERVPGEIGSDTKLCFQNTAEMFISKSQQQYSNPIRKRANSTVYIKAQYA